MIVDVVRSEGAYAAELHEPEEFGAFKVAARGLRLEELDDALQGVGRMADGDAFIDVDAVKRLAGERAREPDWLASFDRMLRYARDNHWMTPGGDAIRAHIET